MKSKISYKDKDELIDHSAVGLFAKSTGVCQAFSAYAYELLKACGIPAHVVFGDGKYNFVQKIASLERRGL